MKKITLLICLMLCGLFVVGGATASAAGKKPMDKEKAVKPRKSTRRCSWVSWLAASCRSTAIPSTRSSSLSATCAPMPAATWVS